MRTLLQLAFILAVSSTAFAQWSNIPPPDIPRAADGKPNLSALRLACLTASPICPASGILRPATSETSRRISKKTCRSSRGRRRSTTNARPENSGEEPDANCLPQGVPKVLLAPAPWQIVDAEGRVLHPRSVQSMVAGVHGRPAVRAAPRRCSDVAWILDCEVGWRHPGRRERWVQRPCVARPVGEAFHEALHVTTKFRRKDFGHMDIGITIDDAKAYTKPWGTTVEVTLLPNTQLMEFICLENEKKTGGK